jgi:hypothetical protein
MQGFQDLVAGEGSSGHEDGPFYSSLFDQPSGMALDPESHFLYLADKGNNCIRSIDLELGNQVSTLAGTLKPGYLDGPFEKALFAQPTLLTFISNHEIAVAEEGNAYLRVLDLSTRTVRTLAGNGGIGLTDGEGSKAELGHFFGMAFLPETRTLYFTQPDLGTFRGYDLASGNVTTLFRSKVGIQKPSALCAHKGRIYVCGSEEGKVFEGVPLKTPGKPGEETWVWSEFAAGHKIRNLGWSGDHLYGIQADEKSPLVRWAPLYQPITFISIWGKTLDDPGTEALFQGIEEGYTPFLITDPNSPGKLFLSHPGMHIVTSYRDLFQKELQVASTSNSGGLTDFEYPKTKPPRTFRILLIGDSHTAYLIGEDASKGMSVPGGNRFLIMAKRLEMMLNLNASLTDGPVRFEVLHDWVNAGDGLNLWPVYKVPSLAKDYDVDLVLFLFSPNYNLDLFYQRPLNQDQIPVEKADPEFLLRPVLERLQPGPALDFYNFCHFKGLADVDPKNFIRFKGRDELFGDPEVLRKLTALYARSYQVLKRKLDSTIGLEGNPVRLQMVFMPFTRFQGQKNEKPFWHGVLEASGAPWFDLSDQITALRPSFYPFSELTGNDHLEVNGHSLISYLLAFDLLQRGIIPGPGVPPKKN